MGVCVFVMQLCLTVWFKLYDINLTIKCKDNLLNATCRFLNNCCKVGVFCSESKKMAAREMGGLCLCNATVAYCAFQNL